MLSIAEDLYQRAVYDGMENIHIVGEESCATKIYLYMQSAEYDKMAEYLRHS